MKNLNKVMLACSLVFGQAVSAQGLEGVDQDHLRVYKQQPNTPIVKTIRLSSGVELEYAEQGDLTGVPVLLLHGFTDSRHSYEWVLPYLPSSLRVFAVSLRGHGNSSKTARRYYPEDFAKDIAGFMEQLKLKPAVIAGHSMGSTIAQCFAVNYPALTRGLVLSASFADYNRPAVGEFKKLIDELKDPVDTAFINEFQKSTLVKSIPGGQLDLFISESRKVPAHVWKGVAEGWSHSDYRKKLESVDKPALIVWGDKDAYCPEEDQLVISRALKKSKLLVYTGTGHALHWEDPEKFALDLVVFINSLH
jgi:pimeloyl-ACP methyl ester carboxylesterase